jgi:sortase A
MRIVRGIGIAFITIGVLILLFVLYELVGTAAITKVHQHALRQEFERELHPTVLTPTEPAVPPPARLHPSEGHAIARLIIPKLGMDVIVVQGVTLDDLAKGPGHYAETPLPGQPGATAIAGHRTGWSAPFYNLDHLRKGDRVTLETSNAKYVYVVTGGTIVSPTSVWVLRGQPGSTATYRLTLTTCTPRFTARNRLIVWADLLSAEPLTSKAAA